MKLLIVSFHSYVSLTLADIVSKLIRYVSYGIVVLVHSQLLLC